MPDGSAVQNLDTDNVISKRRNPVIADVFSRMNYMERRGSGFKKIKDDYHFAVNYRPELEPKFYSDISTFKVTLYNLNYNVPVEKIGVSDEKQAFDEEKTDLQDKKQVFEELLLALDFTTPTKSNILKVFTQVGTETAFARADVMEFTGLTATPATELMRKMKANNLIKSTAKRGKYKFVVPK